MWVALRRGSGVAGGPGDPHPVEDRTAGGVGGDSGRPDEQPGAGHQSDSRWGGGVSGWDADPLGLSAASPAAEAGQGDPAPVPEVEPATSVMRRPGGSARRSAGAGDRPAAPAWEAGSPAPDAAEAGTPVDRHRPGQAAPDVPAQPGGPAEEDGAHRDPYRDAYGYTRREGARRHEADYPAAAPAGRVEPGPADGQAATGRFGAAGAEHEAGRSAAGARADRHRRAEPGSDGAQAATGGASRLAAAVLALAGAVAAGAALLPWSRLSSGDETRTFTGLVAGDGRLTLLLGLALVLIGGRLVLGRAPAAGGGGDGLAARVLALVLVVVAGFDTAIGPPTLSSFRAISADVIELRPEIGPQVTLAAGVVALVAALRLRPGRRRRR